MGLIKKYKYIRSGLLCISIIIPLLLFVTCNGDNDADKIKSQLRIMMNNNPYIQLKISKEDYLYLLCNAKGEAVVESAAGDFMVYRNDDCLVSIGDDTVQIEPGINPLKLIQNALAVAEEDDSITVKTETGGFTLFTLEINGRERIRDVYGNLGDNDADKYMQLLYEGFDDDVSSKMIVRVSIGTDGEFGAVCSMVYGTDDKEYIGWAFDGYIGMFKWELQREWYNNETKDKERWQELRDITIETIADRMSEYMESKEITEDGSLIYEEYSKLSEESKDEEIMMTVKKLESLGFKMECNLDELKHELEEYALRQSVSADTSVMRIIINVGTTKGWLTET